MIALPLPLPLRLHRDLLLLVAGLGVVAAVLVGPAWAPGMVLAPNDLITAGLPGYPAPPARVQNPVLVDVAYAINPWRLLARDEWAAGRLPLWNDRQLLGTPLLANLQSAVFSPWSWLLYLAGQQGAGLAALAWLKLVAAGLGMALFLRRLRLGPWAVALGALSFMLCSHMICWLQWTIAEVFLLGPWLLWLVRGRLDTGGGRWLLGWALGLALALVGGHAESAWNVGALAVAYGAYGLLARAWAARRAADPWRPLLRDGLAWAGASVLGLGLAAAQLLPFLAQLPASLQANERGILAAQRVYLPPEAALTWLVPNGVGNHLHDLYWGRLNYNETTGYVGLIALVLAPLAFRRGPRREAAFWLGTAVVSMGMAWNLPVIGALNALPGFSSSLAYRLHSLTEIALIVLGALGLDSLLRAPRPRLPRWAGVAGTGVGGGALLIGLGLHLPWYFAPHPTAIPAYRAVWFGWALALLGALALLVIAGSVRRWPPRILGGALLALALVDLLRFAWGYNYATPADQFYPPTEFTQALDAQPGRGAVLGAEVQANLAPAYAWRDYRAYDPMLDFRHKRWVRLMSRGTYNGPNAAQYATPMNLLPPRPDMYSVLGLAWVAARAPLDPNALPPEPVPVPAPPAGPAFTRSAEVAGFGLWRNQYARPFVYFAARVRTLPDGEAVWQFYRNEPGAGWDLTLVEDPAPDVAILPAAAAPEARPSADPAMLAVGEGAATVIQSAPGLVEVDARRPPDRPGLLVINESWAPGWQATLDGQPVPIRRANYLAQAVVVPGGAHTVRLVYQPAEVPLGLALSGASVLLWLALPAFAWRERKRI